MDWSIKLDQVLEQEVLRKGKPNKLGFGSYKADNTELIRPYQQESSSPIGRGYPMGIVSGAPTVFDPRAGIQEDPIVTLLKKLLGQKPVVHKAPDAGFKSNDQVYPTSGQSLDLPGRTLGAAPADRGLGGGGGGDVYADSVLSQADTAAGEKVMGWLKRVGVALNNFMWEDDPSVIESSAFGSVYGTASEGSSSEGGMGLMYTSPTTQSDDLAVLHEMFDMVMSASLAENAAMRKEFGEINAYYGGMALAIGLSPYEVMRSLNASATREDRQELANEIFAAFEANVMEQAAAMRAASVELSVHSRPPIDIPGNVGKRRASVLIENLRKRIHRDYSAPTTKGVYKDQAPIGPGQRKPGFPEPPRIIGPIQGPRNRRRPLPTGLTINTGINQYEPYQPNSSRKRMDGGFRMDWNVPPKSSSSGSSFAPSPTDRRKESGKRTSPVATRSKKKM